MPVSKPTTSADTEHWRYWIRKSGVRGISDLREAIRNGDHRAAGRLNAIASDVVMELQAAIQENPESFTDLWLHCRLLDFMQPFYEVAAAVDCGELTDCNDENIVPFDFRRGGFDPAA